MQREALTIGYREVEALRASPLMPVGMRVRGHEFHWSVAEAPPAAVAAYKIVGQDRLEGFCIGNTLGSYVHLNLAGAPHVARRFVASCASGHAESTGGREGARFGELVL
jgi:cobyrinic acid a,c-diamide synthase